MCSIELNRKSGAESDSTLSLLIHFCLLSTKEDIDKQSRIRSELALIGAPDLILLFLLMEKKSKIIQIS